MNINWENLSIGKYLEIKDITNLQTIDEDEKNLRIAAALNNISYDDIINMKLDEAGKLLLGIDFLNHPIPKIKSKKKYVINGNVYELFREVDEMSVAQFINFSYLENDFDNHIIDMLSIFLIPEGHQYNDGYDMEQVKNDISDLSVVEGISIANFFIKRFKRLNYLLTVYLQVEILKIRIKIKLMKKNQDKELLQAMLIQLQLMMKAIEEQQELI